MFLVADLVSLNMHVIEHACNSSILLSKEHGGSVVECWTRDRGLVGSSITRGTALRKTLYPLLSTGSTQEDRSGHG